LEPIRSCDIYLIIPVYNEAAVLRQTLGDVLRLGYNVVVVDDGSSDVSAEIAAGLPVHLLRHSMNLGQGAALVTGIKYALLQNAKMLVTFDADGQHAASDVVALVESLTRSRCDIVLGSRFLQPGNRVPWSRRVLLRAAIVYTRLTTGMRLTDVHNGLRAMTAETARRIRIKQNRMAHASELLSEIAHLRLKYEEIPVNVRYTSYSLEKGQTGFSAFNIMLDLMEARLK
jgi:glycosyltransferase involved in cell wall biosynthesis